MSDIKVDIVLPGQVNTNVESPSQSVTANVSIPSAINIDITSPTQALATNIFIPGPRGPRGENGAVGSINNLSGNLFFTGADGVSILATGNNILVVSGNSGYFQRLIDNLFLQTQTISGNLEILGSGFFTSGIKVGTGTVFIEPSRILINGDPVITRSGLNDVSGYFQSAVNSLSGTVTGNYATINNLASTGSTLTTDLASTGSTLNTKINSLSGSSVLLYGNQTISGLKTFTTGISFILPPSGTGNFSIGPLINITGSLASGNLFTGISINLGADSSTNAGTNRLISARVGGTDRFIVRSDGTTTIGGATTVQGSISTNNNIAMTANSPVLQMYVGGAGNLSLSPDNISGNLSIRNGVNPTQLRVFNRTGTNTGEFGLFGWRNNELIVGPQQTTSGVLRDLTLTGANINISASGDFNIFDNTNISGNLNVTGNILLNGDPVITRSGLNAVSGYFESENTIGYSYVIPVGNDNYFVTYPSVLNSDPRSINCIFQNNVDNIIYYYSIGNINKTGFYINFSDQINNTGYALNINIKK